MVAFFIYACSDSPVKPNEESDTKIDTNRTETFHEVSEPLADSVYLEISDDAEETAYFSAADSIQNILNAYPEFEEWKVFDEYESFYLKGDFYGDGFEDLAVLVQGSSGVSIGIVNSGNETTVDFIDGRDSLYVDEFGWAGVFKTTEPYDTLYSNYEGDWRSLADVPLNEIVILPYNAIYAHAAESCGGGFIFWKDNQWNWLQQE